MSSIKNNHKFTFNIIPKADIWTRPGYYKITNSYYAYPDYVYKDGDCHSADINKKLIAIFKARKRLIK